MARTTDEFDLIGRHLAPLAWAPGALGLRDDAATLPAPPGMDLVTTCDAMVAGVHFLPDDPVDRIARKLLRVNLSDLAAMAARPAAYLLTLALPAGTGEDWVAAFAAGLARDQETFGISLAGGDTVATTGPLTLSLTALGWVAPDRVLRRDGAAAGDDVYASGTIGDASLGLALRRGQIALPGPAGEFLVDRLQLPTPRLELARALAGLATAAIDVSDGLIADLGHLCRASGVAAEVGLADVPVSEAAEALVTGDQEKRLNLLVGGDDYELVFTAPQAAAAMVNDAARHSGVAVTRIGTTLAPEDKPGVRVLDANGRCLEAVRTGYRHVFG